MYEGEAVILIPTLPKKKKKIKLLIFLMLFMFC